MVNMIDKKIEVLDIIPKNEEQLHIKGMKCKCLPKQEIKGKVYIFHNYIINK